MESKRRPTARSTTMDTEHAPEHPASTTRQDPLNKSVDRNSELTYNDEVFNAHSDKSASHRAPPPPPQTAGTLPVQYTRVRAARKNFMRAIQLTGLGSYARQPAQAYPEGMGSIDTIGDTRQLGCQNVHNLQTSSNFSMSLDPATLQCLGCTEKHLFVRKDNPVCIVASDHNFAPVLPAKLGTDCIGILRVEDGTLQEITGMFRDVFRKHIRPAGSLPPGSIVMVGSVSHMALYGLQQYAEDITRTLTIIGSEVGPGITVIPYVPIPLGGIMSDELVRDMLDFDCWLLGSGLGELQTLPSTRELFWETVGGNTDTVVDTGSRTLFLPTSIRNPRKHRFMSGGVCPPAIIEPIGQVDESNIVTCLIGEVSGMLGLKLDASPDFARGGVSPICEHATGRVAFLGASHVQRMSALATACGSTNVLLLPRWASDQSSAKIVAEATRAAKLGKDDILVIDVFSNSAYMGCDESGLPQRPEKGADGRYHILGTMEVATQNVLRKNLAACIPALEAASGARLIFILPIPRYVTRQCCDDPSHIDNRGEADFETIVASAGMAVRTLLEAELAKRKWRAIIFDTMTSFGEEEKLSNTCSSAGLCIWGPQDGVHLTEAAYKDVLDGLRGHLGEFDTCGEAGRKRLSSIVPGTAASTPAAVQVRTPAWISGEASMARGRGGWRGRGGGGRGGRSGRRGRWIGWPY